MMHHDGAEHNIERLIGEVEMLDYSDLKFYGQVALSRFGAGASDLLRARVNAEDTACCANALLHFHRQRSSATAHIQYLLSGLNPGEVSSPLPKLSQFASKQEGVEEPLH